MTESASKAKEILNLIYTNEWSDEERELLLHSMLIKSGQTKVLNTILDLAPDRQACNERILQAVHLVKGKNFGFSGHGVIKLISGRFNEQQKSQIVRLMYQFNRLLQDELNIQSFITSGTLLGMVREGQFLPHDDDFDMAYISNCTDKTAIVNERQKIFEAVNRSTNFNIEERTGGRAAVFVTDENLEFTFDLFAGYRNGECFNEFPLQPDTMLFANIAPVQVAKFYGEDICIPRKPEKLLEVNYGPGWKVPDPSFRFNFGEHRAYYNFLLKPVREQAKKGSR